MRLAAATKIQQDAAIARWEKAVEGTMRLCADPAKPLTCQNVKVRFEFYEGNPPAVVAPAPAPAPKSPSV
jgi:hypothetical protein